MENLLGLSPIKIFLGKEAMRQAIWLKAHGHWIGGGTASSHRTVCERLLGELATLRYPQERNEIRYCFNRRFHVVIGDGKEEEEQTGWTIYTDGSRKEGLTGAGIFMKVPNGEQRKMKIPLGEEATVNQAELHAIAMAARAVKEE